MTKMFRSLKNDRRGAFALIFAGCLLPLVYLVSLSIDYSFWVEARAQASLAADASATHAIRAAAQTYSYEIANNIPVATAYADAEAAGQLMGGKWFRAQLGTFPTSTIPGDDTGATNPLIQITQNADGSAGFTANVSFTGTYPTFFGGFFNNKPWHINGTAGASTSYNYLEILMMLDNSGSMLIGASPADYVTIENSSVCVPNTLTSPTGAVLTTNPVGAVNWSQYDQNSISTIAPLDQTQFKHYTRGAAIAGTSNPTQYAAGRCDAGYYGPYMPCALACHTTSTPSPQNAAYSNDWYGLARQALAGSGGQVRLDVLHSAVTQVINSMIQDQQGQLAVGVYEFNSDISPVAQGPVGANGLKAEATTNLQNAATAVSNAALPIFPNGAINNSFFPTSINDLISGKYSSGVAFGNPLANAGTGQSAQSPLKDLFIITDGMEDDNVNGNALTARVGEMTGVNVENTGLPFLLTYPALCYKLKHPPYNYNIYVLYVDYYPLPEFEYQNTFQSTPPYTAQDYPLIANTFIKNSNEPVGNSPVTAALQACSSGNGSATSQYYHEANDSASISTALSAMLKSALTSSIRITN